MTEPAVREPVPPTGTQHTIAAHGYAATVTEVGGGLRALTYHERPLVMSYPADAQPVGGAGQLLLPWPNRVRDGRYDVDGETRQLAITEPRTGNAAHGYARLMPWTVLDRDDASIRLALRLFPQLGYPHVLDLTASYALGEAGLEVEVSAVNVGEGVAPYGMGAHPYLTLGEETVDDAVLEVPAAEWTPVEPSWRATTSARACSKVPVSRGPRSRRTVYMVYEASRGFSRCRSQSRSWPGDRGALMRPTPSRRARPPGPRR